MRRCSKCSPKAYLMAHLCTKTALKGAVSNLVAWSMEHEALPLLSKAICLHPRMCGHAIRFSFASTGVCSLLSGRRVLPDTAGRAVCLLVTREEKMSVQLACPC